MKSSIHRSAWAVGLAGLMVLAGCSSPDAEFDSGDPAPATSQEGAEAGSDQSAEGEEARQVTDEPAGATWPDPDDVIAEDVFPTLDSTTEKVRIGVQGIYVTDETMELRLVITPEENVEKIRLVDVTRNTFSQVSIALIDRENLKRYSVLKAASGGGVYQKGDTATVRAGETIGFQAFYPAPTDDIDHIDIELGGSLPVFEDVPLTFQE